jgi:hypothetical protein
MGGTHRSAATGGAHAGQRGSAACPRSATISPDSARTRSEVAVAALPTSPRQSHSATRHAYVCHLPATPGAAAGGRAGRRLGQLSSARPGSAAGRVPGRGSTICFGVRGDPAVAGDASAAGAMLSCFSPSASAVAAAARAGRGGVAGSPAACRRRRRRRCPGVGCVGCGGDTSLSACPRRRRLGAGTSETSSSSEVFDCPSPAKLAAASMSAVGSVATSLPAPPPPAAALVIAAAATTAAAAAALALAPPPAAAALARSSPWARGHPGRSCSAVPSARRT